MSKVNIPLFIETTRRETGDSARADFIYEFTPDRNSNEFREMLRLALEEVVKEQLAEAEAENARLKDLLKESLDLYFLAVGVGHEVLNSHLEQKCTKEAKELFAKIKAELEK